MVWNHRVIRFKDKSIDGGYRYEFKEVFYNEDGEKTGYSDVFLWSEDIHGMQELADRLLLAVTKKPIDESEFTDNNLVSNRDMEAMAHFAALKRMGYAVVAFTPEELKGADADNVEERLIELGTDVIDYFSEEEEA